MVLTGVAGVGRGCGDRGELGPENGVWAESLRRARAGFLLNCDWFKNREGLCWTRWAAVRGPGAKFRPEGQRHAAILVTQLSLATRKCSHNRF